MGLFVAGQPLTAAQMNATNGYVLKTADQSVTSSATLANDAHLSYAIPAAGTYAFESNLIAVSAANAAGDLQVGWSFPTGTMYAWGVGPDASLAAGASVIGLWSAGAITTGTAVFTFGLSTQTVAVLLKGLFVATASGTLRLMWSQSSSNANASTVKAGSHMLVRQVA